jgi:hypothetical protein
MLWVKSSTEEVDVRSSSLFCCSGWVICDRPSDNLPVLTE